MCRQPVVQSQNKESNMQNNKVGSDGTKPCADDKVKELHENYNTEFGSSQLSSDDNCLSAVTSDWKATKPLK